MNGKCFHDTSCLDSDQRARWATGRDSSHERANAVDAFTPHHLLGASAGTRLPPASPLLKEPSSTPDGPVREEMLSSDRRSPHERQEMVMDRPDSRYENR